MKEEGGGPQRQIYFCLVLLYKYMVLEIPPTLKELIKAIPSTSRD